VFAVLVNELERGTKRLTDEDDGALFRQVCLFGGAQRLGLNRRTQHQRDDVAHEKDS
jgi:hypothetical protein